MEEHSALVFAGPDLPAKYLPLAKAQGKYWLICLNNDAACTLISPASDFQAEGASYILAGKEPHLNDQGKSIIGYADYAIAMVDEIVNGSYVHQRISVARK